MQNIGTCKGLIEFDFSPVQHLIANRYPVNEFSNSRRYDQVQTLENYEVGILVTSNRVENLLGFINVYFESGHFLALVMLIELMLFNWFILRRHGWQLFKFNYVIALSFLQSTTITRRHHKRKGARILIGAIIVLNFVLAQFVNCIFTVRLMDFIMDHPINTLKEVSDRNVTVYVEDPSNCFGVTNGTKILMKIFPKLFICKGSLWKINETEPYSAYITNMKLQKRLLESAANVNAFGKERYYKINELLVSMPLVTLLPAHSPFSHYIKELNFRFFEAGLLEHLITYELATNKYEGFNFFSHNIKFVNPLPLTASEMAFAFVFLIIGHLMAFVAFLVETWR